jgi:glycosyltransferase involved in cell wall biosynthesis
MKKLPISVNICTYNEEENIGKCLDRVFANNPAEVIVIDGHSTDRTVEIAKKKGAKVIMAKKRGLSSQRQQGIENSTQPYIAIIDADDHIEENFLSTLLSEMQEYGYDALLGREIAYKPKSYWEKAMESTN